MEDSRVSIRVDIVVTEEREGKERKGGGERVSWDKGEEDDGERRMEGTNFDPLSLEKKKRGDEKREAVGQLEGCRGAKKGRGRREGNNELTAHPSTSH